MATAARRSERRRRAKPAAGALFGRTLSPRRTARAARLWGLIALGLAAVAFAMTQWGWTLAAEAPLQAWIAVGAALAIAVFFAASLLALRSASRWRTLVQGALTLAVAVAIFGFFLAPAGGLPKPPAWGGLLTDDYWPMIPVAFVLAIPLALWMHRELPLRAFLIVCLTLFVMLLPEYLGILTVDTGMRSGLGRFTLPSWSYLYLDPDAAARQRASGMVPLLFLLALLAGWLPLVAMGLWRRWRVD